MLPGPPDKPSFPGNILADFAGGGLIGALGIMLAIQELAKTGKGKVVNIDMVSTIIPTDSHICINSLRGYRSQACDTFRLSRYSPPWTHLTLRLAKRVERMF